MGLSAVCWCNYNLAISMLARADMIRQIRRRGLLKKTEEIGVLEDKRSLKHCKRYQQFHLRLQNLEIFENAEYATIIASVARKQAEDQALEVLPLREEKHPLALSKPLRCGECLWKWSVLLEIPSPPERPIFEIPTQSEHPVLLKIPTPPEHLARSTSTELGSLTQPPTPPSTTQSDTEATGEALDVDPIQNLSPLGLPAPASTSVSSISTPSIASGTDDSGQNSGNTLNSPPPDEILPIYGIYPLPPPVPSTFLPNSDPNPELETNTGARLETDTEAKLETDTEGQSGEDDRSSAHTDTGKDAPIFSPSKSDSGFSGLAWEIDQAIQDWADELSHQAESAPIKTVSSPTIS
ncbi:hypothetical protein N658DRAFT_483983 [Parathielavia hyrcaniae]|uniref:Uncharacterized protein n=1 Tax=Parathielavia hyrcaniae TaxID=113614 RepID=A0AAN6QAY6_9PEZI|nr:hypothetical protein N658DRAFT_483983 [Parathielavia hyrcaniae]